MTPNECCFILKQDRERESSMQATELEKTENYYRTQMQKDSGAIKRKRMSYHKAENGFNGCYSEWQLQQLQRNLL